MRNHGCPDRFKLLESSRTVSQSYPIDAAQVTCRPAQATGSSYSDECEGSRRTGCAAATVAVKRILRMQKPDIARQHVVVSTRHQLVAKLYFFHAMAMAASPPVLLVVGAAGVGKTLACTEEVSVTKFISCCQRMPAPTRKSTSSLMHHML